MAAAFDWSGFEQSLISGLARPLLVARGSKGYAACAYINLDAAGSFCLLLCCSPPVAAARILLSLLLCCLWLKALFPEKFEEACVIFTGVSTCEDFVEAEVLKCSSAAEKLGCSVGMRGADALELLR